MASSATPDTATAPAIAFDGGLTCSIGVTSLDAAIPWYTDILGMKLLYRLDDLAWCELESPVARVNVGLSQVENAGGPGGATLTFGVVDIDAAKAALDAAGVKQDGPIQDIPEMVQLLTFFDPDGNTLMLYQDLSSPPS